MVVSSNVQKEVPVFACFSYISGHAILFYRKHWFLLLEKSAKIFEDKAEYIEYLLFDSFMEIGVSF